jgi:ribosomal protein L39E
MALTEALRRCTDHAKMNANLAPPEVIPSERSPTLTATKPREKSNRLNHQVPEWLALSLPGTCRPEQTHPKRREWRSFVFVIPADPNAGSRIRR